MMQGLHKTLAVFALFLLLWGLIFFDALRSMTDVWASSETYKHCFFILPISLYLLYERRAELAITHFSSNLLALPIIIIALALNLMAQLLGINLLAHAASYIALVGIIWLCLGNDFFARFRFPILFLGFAVPFGEELVPALQDITAYITVELLQSVGIPIYREGLYLYVPNGTFLVAEACAGIRFLIASFALGTLFAYLNYRTPWKFLAFVAASLIVPIIANGIRAFGIVVIGYLSDMKYATGADHLIYGWVFFAFVLFVLFAIGQIGQEDTSVSVDERHPRGSVDNMRARIVCGVMLIMLLIPIYTQTIINTIPDAPQVALTDKLSSIGEIQAREYTWKPNLRGPDEEWMGSIDGHPAYVALFHYDTPEKELISGLHRYYNIDVFTRQAHDRINMSDGSFNVIHLVDVRGNKVSLAYWFEVSEKRHASQLMTKVSQAFSKLIGEHGKGAFVAVQFSTEEELPMLFQRLRVQ